MRFLTLIILLFTFSKALCQEDQVMFEHALSLQYAYYDDDHLTEMLFSTDSVNIKKARNIIEDMQRKSIVEYDKLIESFPQSSLLADALFQKAEALYSTGSIEKAKEAYLAVVSNDPGKYDALSRLAAIFFDERNYSEALCYIEQKKNLNLLVYGCGIHHEIEEREEASMIEQCLSALNK